jgi:hypothetical protein
MHTVYLLFWVMQPTYVRLFVVYLVAITAVSIVRFVKVGTSLYLYSDEPISPEKIVSGLVNPDSIAEAALANRIVWKVIRQNRSNLDDVQERAQREKVLVILRTSGAQFLRLRKILAIDLKAINKAVWLTLLLSCLVVVYGGPSTFSDVCNNGKLPALACLVVTLGQLSIRLSLGLAVCAALFAASSFFDHTLARRQILWRYGCEVLMNELSTRQ